MEIRGNSVTGLYEDVLNWAKVAPGASEKSRVGICRTFDEPLTIVNTRPHHRVLFNAERDINPFFHLLEVIWMFAGSNNGWVTKFNSRMASYMDGEYFWGAYGHRWRRNFGKDQVEGVINLLQKTPNTRRAFLGIWDPAMDLGTDAKDIPCNLGMAFQLRQGRLNGYVFNRSNDLIWGMMGTNCVQFSMLLEVVAECADLEMGSLYQISANPHIYEHHEKLLQTIFRDDHTEYVPRRLAPRDWQSWSTDAEVFIERGWEGEYMNSWFTEVASPMLHVYLEKDPAKLDDICAQDWRIAAKLWCAKHRGIPMRGA